jgi:hypothetical protein
MYNNLIKAIVNNDNPGAVALVNSLPLEVLGQTTAYDEELDCYLSPLHVAALYNRGEILDALIAKGLDINQPTREVYGYGQSFLRLLSFNFWSRAGKYTALHLAGLKSHQDIIKKLVSSDANYSLKDSKGNFALSFEQLCLAVDNNVKKMDLSMYSFDELSFERLGPLFLNNNFETLIFGEMSCKLKGNKKHKNFYFKLLDLTSKCPALKYLHLEISFTIKTDSVNGFFHAPAESLVSGRKGFLQIMSATVEFVKKQSALEYISIGNIIHKHEDEVTNLERTTTTRPDGKMESNLDINTRIYDEESELLSLSHDKIMAVAENPAESKQEFLNDNKDRLENCDLIWAMENPHQKLYDPDVFVSACVIISEVLLERKAAARESARQHASAVLI